VFVGGFGYPFYPYSYYGYPYYGYPYYGSYFDYGYPYYGSYSSGYDSYDYGYGNYNQPRYRENAYGGSMVAQVQRRLAREGYYHGAIDGIMGTRTHYAIRAFERANGLRVDGAISNQLLATMDLR
jgi:peptidoglycan hydrolase-like protein with peptidoglycan-binding domain